MAIPKYKEIYRPLLDTLQDGSPHNIAEIRECVAKAMGVTVEERKEMHPSGNSFVFNNRLGWACTYLKKAGLIDSPQRSVFVLTPTGKSVLQDNPPIISNEYLMRFDSFRTFKMRTPQETGRESTESLPSEDTPQDIFDKAFAEINVRLSDDLLTEIMKQSSDFFEVLVVRLLQKMGYGGSVPNSGTITKRSGDEGIDGIIREDKLGFDFIYIQAKQWGLDRTVGRPEVQKFVGALVGKGATKGLFITTAKFTEEAKRYVDGLRNEKIILVDGEMLTRLMIEHNIGVSTNMVYEIKRLDSDFFLDNDSN